MRAALMKMFAGLVIRSFSLLPAPVQQLCALRVVRSKQQRLMDRRWSKLTDKHQRKFLRANRSEILRILEEEGVL